MSNALVVAVEPTVGSSGQVAPAAPPDAAGNASGGANHAQRAAAIATVSTLVTLADRVDSLLYGKRVRFLVTTAALVVFTPVAMGVVDGPTWAGPLAAVAFVVLFATLALARIAMLRDDQGRWAPSFFFSNALAEATELAQSFKTFLRGRANQRLRIVGSSLIGGALVVLAVRRVADLVYESGLDSWVFDWGEGWEWIAFLLGALTWALGFSRERTEGQRGLLLVDPSNAEGTRAVALAFTDLPALIDCRDAATAEALAAQASHPLLGNLLKVLGQWRPRRADAGLAYQVSLHRKLRELMPAADPRREVPLRSQGLRYTGRVDILLGECVAIEMKRRLTTSTAQKAVGQMQMYAGLWRGRGPLVLLLCDTDAEFAASFLEAPIYQLRTAGHSVVAILAAA